MQRLPLESSSLASAAYDSVLHRLEVEFRNGERYLFFRVPLGCYQQFMDSESKGAYFNRYIRNRFAFKHLTRPRRPIVLPLPDQN